MYPITPELNPYKYLEQQQTSPLDSFRRLWVICAMVISTLAILFACLLAGCHEAWAEVYDADQLVDIIYIIEGGEKAKKPFGVLSVPCEGYDDCRKICYNTVVNSFTRWQADGSQGDFLETLSRRYAPVNSDTDNGTNKFWLENLNFYLAKEKK